MYRLLIVSVLLFVVMSCKNENNGNTPDNAVSPEVVNNPATASSNPTSSKDNVPVIKFEADTHDFGNIIEGEKVSYAYKFQNIGKAPLVIRAAQGSCGCTVPEYPKDPVPPGGSGIVNVTFNSEGKEGHQEKTVTIISNTMPNTYMIYIMGEVAKSK
jgi:hypothetical protein